jgi:DNA helicase II / ATP-dependent DNA helicase PcrA
VRVVTTTLHEPPAGTAEAAEIADDARRAALNPEQQAAATHGLHEPGGAPPLLIVAGAGTGKTQTLAARVVELVAAGTDPSRILLLSFSRRAAAELQRRVAADLHARLRLAGGASAPELAWAGTFHSIGARLLRAWAPSLGLDEGYTVLDRSDATDLLGMAREKLGLAEQHRRFPTASTCQAILSRQVNAGEPLAQVLDQQFPWCKAWHDELHALFNAYLHDKQQQHALDYDDLLVYWHEAMGHEALAQTIGAQFQAVLVDEMQDTNRLQAGILRRLKPDGRGLTVVGDDAQSIYGFRAAEVANLTGFAAWFSPPAHRLKLERNYRSTPGILAASNAVIAESPEALPKTLWTARTAGDRPWLVAVDDELAQARWVADRVLALREEGLALKRQAVLFRTASHSATLELELARRQIPFVKFGGLRFLEAAHVKDLLAVLRLAENPRDRLALFRVAQLVPGIGPVMARRACDAVDRAADPWVQLQALDVPAPARADWQAWLQAMAGLAPSDWPRDVTTALAWYRPQLERRHADASVRALDLEQLARLAGQHGDRRRFLTEMALDPPEATSDESRDPSLDEDYLILSTIHTAKGQEWTAVTVLNVVDGCMPADVATRDTRQVEEERRLLYVAMTRAREHLHLMLPQRFHVTEQRRFGDRHLYGGLSRFVTPAVRACLREVVEAGATPDAARSTTHRPALQPVDLMAAVRRRGGGAEGPLG